MGAVLKALGGHKNLSHRSLQSACSRLCTEMTQTYLECFRKPPSPSCSPSFLCWCLLTYYIFQTGTRKRWHCFHCYTTRKFPWLTESEFLKIFAGKKSYNSAFLPKAKYVCEKCWNWDFIWDKMENHIPHSNLIFLLFSSHTAIHLGLGFKRKLYLEIFILKLLKWIEFNNRTFQLNQTITAQMNGSRI